MNKDLNYKPGDIILFVNPFSKTMDIGELIDFFNYSEGDKFYIIDWWFSRDDPQNAEFHWSHNKWGQAFAKARDVKEATFRMLFSDKYRKGIYEE